MDVLGTAAAAGPLIVSMDLASGRNSSWLGPGHGTALAEGGTCRWHTRFDLNIGCHF